MNTAYTIVCIKNNTLENRNLFIALCNQKN